MRRFLTGRQDGGRSGKTGARRRRRSILERIGLRRAFSMAALMAALAVGAAPVQAQNMFAPVARVNDGVITAYELSQRTAFLTLLKAPGNPRDLAMQQLVEERLKGEVAERMGITISADKVKAGMTEFAARANLTPEKFIQAIGQAGVAAETFRDFVSNGMIWREVVRARFAGRIDVSDADIDRALAEAKPERGVRVLLAEIMLPADNPANKRASITRARILARINDVTEFAEAARVYSIASTRDDGGALDWRNLSTLPGAVRAQVARLSPGQVTAPITLGTRVALYQLRERQNLPSLAPGDLLTEYARLFLPGGRSDANLTLARKIDDQTDSCDELYAFAKDQPEDALQIETRPVSQIPTEIAMELAKLDPGEISTELTTNGGQTLELLMLCSRSALPAESVSRDQIRAQLANQQLVALANAYIQELKANANIEYIRR